MADRDLIKFLPDVRRIKGNGENASNLYFVKKQQQQKK